MQTKLIKIDADDPNKEDMQEAAEIIRSGFFSADDTDFVLDQRMIHYYDFSHFNFPRFLRYFLHLKE